MWGWLVVLLLAGSSRFFSSWGWPIDLVANVSVWVLIPVVLTWIALAIRRRRMELGAITVIFLITFTPTGRILLSSDSVIDGSASEIRIMSVNIQNNSMALDRLVPIIEREQPDVVAIVEVGLHLAKPFVERPEIAKMYPFSQVARRDVEWQYVLLSRWPMHQLTLKEDFDSYNHLFAYQRSVFIDSPDHGRFLFSAIHAQCPRTGGTWERGNEKIEWLLEVCERFLIPTGVPVIVAGDFNSTPSGHRYRMIQRSGLLHPADMAGGLCGTWPTSFPGPLRLAIDHVWGSTDVVFTSQRVLEEFGSDHRPILVTGSFR